MKKCPLANLLLGLILAYSCGKKTGPKETEENPLFPRLRAKAAFYLHEAKLDAQGWIQDTKCDGLLFNSLYALGGGESDPTLARGAAGVWYRHHLKDCYPSDSQSTISRDMFEGLFLWIWKNQRRDLIEEIINYGEAHRNALGSWVMGEGNVFATGIRVEMQATAYEIRYRLGGADHGLRRIPQIRFEVKGYEEHLQMLDILLRALVIGKITDMDLKAARDSAKKEPYNALYSAIYHRYSDGDQSQALKILLDETLFPTNRLPSSKERCESYLWQRTHDRDGATDPDWLPCPEEGRIFSAVDFLFAKAIILNEI